MHFWCVFSLRIDTKTLLLICNCAVMLFTYQKGTIVALAPKNKVNSSPLGRSLETTDLVPSKNIVRQ